MRERVDRVIRADAVLTPAGFVRGAVTITGGIVTAILPIDEPVETRPIADSGLSDGAATDIRLPSGRVLLPGLVDTHVHVNEPGRTDWEGFASATRAAAAGGVTTVIDMPLNSIPPTTTVSGLDLKRAAAGPQASVNVGFWGGAVPGNLGTLRELHSAGVFGFKAFLSPSGVEEFPALSSAELLAAAAEISAFGGLLLVHAEDPAELDAAPPATGRSYAGFLASRPPQAEASAIDRVIDAVRRTGVSAHILHLSAGAALPRLRAARAEGLPITVETCPHYLSFAAEQIPDGATAFKCCPPIRDAANRELLWAGLLDGTIDLVASDHSPATRELKLGHGGDFGLAWGGISGLELSLPAVWTAAGAAGIGLDRVIGWMSTATARFAGLTGKGIIRPGADADLVSFAPEESFTVDVGALQHKNPVSAFDGATLRGRVHGTWLAGALVHDTGAGNGITSPAASARPEHPPRGALLRRPAPTRPAPTRPAPTP
ncbi:allantoinase AllB [Cryobacterium sp. MDB1-18-2]|uniref:allantoinase AllB n=1 Tax=unclassified Cryobacterium TaxID=2649013 RepID=UPI00106A3C6F|nr:MULTISPECIES: allantoinase AllB [unclassified Cryobacterium]TFC24963.1 allantoinase AllB [Cryobacterium sp. MDB1-18-2]TFC45729.1 allantoinase AllB [Cryobacterium sp. MDB1-18-1]